MDAQRKPSLEDEDVAKAEDVFAFDEKYCINSPTTTACPIRATAPKNMYICTSLMLREIKERYSSGHT